MSENNDPQENDPVDERTPVAGITVQLGWESLEHEQPSAAQPRAGERAVIELPDKRRASRRRNARQAGEPARAGRHGELSWRAAGAAAALAACVGVAMALAITGPREHPPHAPRSSTGTKPYTMPRQPLRQRERRRRAPRRGKVATALTPTRAGSHIRVPVLSQPTSVSRAAGGASPPAPVQHADAEGQTPGGPFSP